MSVRFRRIAAGCALGLCAAFASPAPALAEPYEDNPDAATRDPDYAAGKTALEKKNFKEAVMRFHQAALRDPKNADLQNYLGYSYRNLKEFEPAFRHYKQALALNPRHRGAHEYIGEAYLLVNDLPSAEKHLALLRSICLLACEELADLEKAVKQYRAGARR